MLNAATSSAIAANAVSPVDRKPRKPLLMSSRFSVASCVPVMACTPAGSTGRSRAASSVAGTPGLARTRIWVSSAWPGPLGPVRYSRAACSVIPVNVPGPKPRQQARVDAGACAVARTDLGRPAQHHIGTPVGLGEEPVEVGPQGVAQQQGPGQEGHPEGDREQGGDQPPLARPQAARGD